MRSTASRSSEPDLGPSTESQYGHADYLDPAKVEAELRRVGEVCHQCRRCLPLCPAFPKLFELVDATEHEIAGVSLAGFEAVNELCFHCKQCFNHCPYTPPHAWDVDVPALMRRHQVLRAQQRPPGLARRLLTRTDWVGRLGAFAPGLLNFANRNRVARVLLEKTAGIHRDWVQPRFHRRTARRWFARRAPREGGEAGRVVLFPTCSVNYSDPTVARAAAEVLEHAGVRVDFAYPGCCGMPRTDVGDLDGARAQAARVVAALLPHVEGGALVVVPGPSCSLMLKREYPELLASDAARRVAEATRDLMEHVYDLAKAKRLPRDFKRSVGRVAYHAPCHLRAQNLGFRFRDVLRLVSDEVALFDACSGVDGTWGMQARFHDASLAVAKKLLGGIEQAKPDHVATDCPLSALRVAEGLGRPAVHPIVLLHQAYGFEEAR